MRNGGLECQRSVQRYADQRRPCRFGFILTVNLSEKKTCTQLKNYLSSIIISNKQISLNVVEIENQTAISLILILECGQSHST